MRAVIYRVLIFTIIFLPVCSLAQAFGAGSLDDLYRLAKNSSKFHDVSKARFLDDVARLPIDDFMPLINSFPKDKHNLVLLEIAEKKGLIKPTEVLYYNNQLKGVDGYNNVLLVNIKNNNKELGPLINNDLRTIRASGNIDFISAAKGWTEYEKKLLKTGKLRKINGKKVVQRDDIIDTAKKDAKGRSNCERMQKGFSPLGKDNLPIELHHMGQENAGVIVELIHTEHKTNSKDLHYHKTTSEIDRVKFNEWRKGYWKDRPKGLCK